MNTFPAFPGKEINYLRAQIARISASCHISPQGLYMLVEDDDDDDDDEDTKGEIKQRGIERKLNLKYGNILFEQYPMRGRLSKGCKCPE